MSNGRRQFPAGNPRSLDTAGDDINIRDGCAQAIKWVMEVRMGVRAVEAANLSSPSAVSVATTEVLQQHTRAVMNGADL